MTESLLQHVDHCNIAQMRWERDAEGFWWPPTLPPSRQAEYKRMVEQLTTWSDGTPALTLDSQWVEIIRTDREVDGWTTDIQEAPTMLRARVQSQEGSGCFTLWGDSFQHPVRAGLALALALFMAYYGPEALWTVEMRLWPRRSQGSIT